jgi:integrase
LKILWPVLREISNSRHRTAIFSPSSNRATNLSFSSTLEHSCHGILRLPQKPESVTYVSGMLCYLCVRKDIPHSSFSEKARGYNWGYLRGRSASTPTFAVLTDSEIRKTQAKDRDFKLFDGGSLFLLVRASGHRGWRFKYRVNGHEKLISLGPYPTVSLAKARLKLRRAKALLLDGIDPSAKRRAEKYAGAESFEAVAREWYGSHACRWADSYSDHIIRRFERDIFPWIGNAPIRKITPGDLLACLRRIEARGTHETAHRVYQNICWVFRHAAVTRRCAYDPSAPIKGMLLPTREQHLASITEPAAFGELLRAIEAYTGSIVVRSALRLAPLVFVRPAELRGAEWPEFDFDAQEWRIPARRMKMRVPHIVPLSTQAIAILKDLKPATGDGKFVFPSPRSRSRPLSNVALLAALRRMGYEQGTVTVHGFRASASTLLNEQGWRADAIERQLAHGERNLVRAAYNHAQYLAERRLMMQGWGNYLDQLRSGTG